MVLALLDAFPDARLVTSIYEPRTTYDEFAGRDIETMWPNKLSVFRQDPRRALPVLAKAFDNFKLHDTDIVIASTSGWAHAIGTSVPRIVYCHNPARWLHQTEDYFQGKPRVLSKAFRKATRSLREWDRRHALESSMYFANSHGTKERIATSYGIDAEVLPPPAGLTPDGPMEPVPSIEPGFMLTVSRSRAYKNTTVACEAIQALPGQRLVCVGGLPPRSVGSWSDRIQSVTSMTDAQMRWLYANCQGVIAVGREDFGLSPVEGYGFGKPAAVLRAGGYLTSSAPGVASVWVEDISAEATADAVDTMAKASWDPRDITSHAHSFSVHAFQNRMRTAVSQMLNAPTSLRLIGGRQNQEEHDCGSSNAAA